MYYGFILFVVFNVFSFNTDFILVTGTFLRSAEHSQLRFKYLIK